MSFDDLLNFIGTPFAWIGVLLLAFIVYLVWSWPRLPSGHPVNLGRALVVVPLLLLVDIALFSRPIHLVGEGRQEKYLRANGLQVIAHVTGVKQLQWIDINDKYPWVIRAVYVDPQGNTHEAESHYVWTDPRPAITRRQDEIPVYIDPQNPSRYVMDTSGLDGL